MESIGKFCDSCHDSTKNSIDDKIKKHLPHIDKKAFETLKEFKNAPGVSGKVTLYHVAAAYNACGAVEKLTQLYGEFIDTESENRQTPLATASSFGHLEMVKLIVKKRGEKAIKDCSLFLAAANGRMEVVEFLLKAGAEINQQDKAGWTPLHVAAHQGHYDVVKLLIDHKAIKEAKNAGGMTALQLAEEHLKKLANDENHLWFTPQQQKLTEVIAYLHDES